MRSYWAESGAGIDCRAAEGSGALAAFCCELHARVTEARSSTSRSREDTITSRVYLITTTGSFFAAQTRATIQPITLHPRKRFSRKIARRSRLLRASAINDGRKYMSSGRPNPRPKNGKKYARWNISFSFHAG